MNAARFSFSKWGSACSDVNGGFARRMYSSIKTLTFKVVVKGKEITVFPTFRKLYSFSFGEIVSVVR